jgi:hypothetical protein
MLPVQSDKAEAIAALEEFLRSQEDIDPADNLHALAAMTRDRFRELGFSDRDIAEGMEEMLQDLRKQTNSSLFGLLAQKPNSQRL